MCFNGDDEPVQTPLDVEPVTGIEIVTAIVELVIVCTAFMAAVMFVSAIAEVIR